MPRATPLEFKDFLTMRLLFLSNAERVIAVMENSLPQPCIWKSKFRKTLCSFFCR